MFESDDFDQVLSQFDFPEVDNVEPRETVSTEPGSQDYISCTNESAQKIIDGITSDDKTETKITSNSPKYVTNNAQGLTKNRSEIHFSQLENSIPNSTKVTSNSSKTINPNTTKKPIEESQYNLRYVDNFVSPKHLKRKIINSHFDQQSKRKFPGPAGLLSGILEETKDESIGQIEFLSQDMDFTESNLRIDLFKSPLWQRLLSDTREWKVVNVDSIKAIKQQALAGNLQKRKAQTVTAFIEAIDRSVTDPLIILRDETGSIKCTLHRDAWSTFSPYIVSEYCALVLQKPTVLTTGGAFKKHYLNITLSNILGIFSSAVLKERILPDKYSIEYEEEFTVIKAEPRSENIETFLNTSDNAEGIFDGLDNIFSDEIF